MAISISSLSPLKNQLNVPVNSDIEITLTSDAADLDVYSTKLFINGVEVQPSAYYGGSNTEVNVAFYAKKRIKYATRRYGQDEVRYGKRDIYPSIFQYGYRYVCTVEIEDKAGNKFSENFSFVIEDGIFYSLNAPTSFYYPQTQAFANYTPEWARSRYDKYSNFQQLINPSCRFMQEMQDSLYAQTSSYYVQTSNLNELATLYKVELGGDFEFQTIVLDDGTRLQIPPEVSTIKDITKYEPNAEYTNDIKDFYYNKLPSRLDETKIKIDTLLIYPKTLATEKKIILNKTLIREGKFCLLIEDSKQFTQLINNDFRFVYCRVTGISRENKRQVEDILIIDNDTYYSTKLWKEIESVQFVNLPEESNLHFSLDHARIPGSYIPDSFLDVSISDTEKSSFWKLGETLNGSILQQWVLLEVDPDDIISSLGQKDLIKEFELMDIDGVTNLNLLEVDVDKFSNWLYGIDQNYFYIFDKREAYSDIVKMMPEINGTADFILNIDADELGRGDSGKTIGINCIQKSPTKELAQFRLSITRPDSTVEYIMENNDISTDKLTSYNVVKSNTFQYIGSTLFYDLDIPGDYLVKLESVYRDGSTGIDAKIIRIHKKVALAKYKLERIFGDASIVRMFVDFDHQIKILDSNNELHTIRFARDNMLIDYSNSILYFSEEYDEVEV